jgi:molybdopterin converting factor small subunit
MPLVKLYSNLRNLAETEEVSIAGTSVGEVLSGLVKRNLALTSYLFENEQVRPHIIVTINGHTTP